ncbi:MAG TPA: hypothetical protein VNN80_22310, partial [Polyangiaceae bacterium]|nr:hypothetical protein [Polyangiaceae bacterium]
MNKFLRIASLSVPLVVVAVGVTHADQGTWSLPYQGADDNPNTPFGYATVKLTKRNGGAAAEFVTENTDTSKTSYTVHVTSPGNVTALFSQSVDGIGVLGNSVSGTGLFGSSSLGEGVFGRSPVGVGVHGNTDSGTGVIGESIDGDGIRGDAQTYGTGVLGNSVD